MAKAKLTIKFKDGHKLEQIHEVGLVLDYIDEINQKLNDKDIRFLGIVSDDKKSVVYRSITDISMVGIAEVED